jgi:pyruvate,water dikinase
MLCTFNQFSEKSHGQEAGGKGATLAKLYQSGYPVPNGFILLSSCFNEKGLLGAAREALISHYHQLIEKISTGKVAVRSSGLSEDSATASFAGEFETVLNVSSEDELLNAVQTVFDSSKSERANAYAKAQNISDIHTIAVVVQQMLAPSMSGILFTTDPVSGDDNIMQGNLTKGLGEQLVSGEVTGDVFTLQASSGAYDGPDYFKPYQSELFRLASKLVADFKTPQDIEWAVENDKLFLLQARPITTLPQIPNVWNESLKGDYLWSNSNIGEIFGCPVTPFTWSIFKESVDRGLGSVNNHPMAGLIGGRIYLNLSLFVSILNKLGKPKENILKEFDLFLGQIPDHVDIPLAKVTLGGVLGFMARQMKGTFKSYMSHKKFLKWIREECLTWCETKFQAIERCQNNADLLRLYPEVESVFFKSLEMIGFTFNLLIQQQRKKFRPALSKVLSSEDLEIMMSGLGGDEQLKSMGPLLGISAMKEGKMTREAFIRNYGHRGPNEAEFSTPRTGENPDWIDILMDQWRDSDVDRLLQKQKENRERIWKEIDQKLPKQANKLRKLFAASAIHAQNREYVRSESIRQMWVIRKFVEKAAQLNGLGDELYYLSKSEVLRYLQGDTGLLENVKNRRETYNICKGLPALPNIISGQIDLLAWAKDPKRRTDYFDSHHTQVADNENQIKGFPGSAGVVEGFVRVLNSHEQMDQFKSGEVLVTSVTNVGWTPLFPRAAAIVTDIGAPLSHAAIVARELGIPAVVGAGTATMRLKTGDKVRINGSEGVVELLG